MPAGVYYNEIDPYAAAWLRNLIAAGHIAPGDVDERSIEDVHPDDLRPRLRDHDRTVRAAPARRQVRADEIAVLRKRLLIAEKKRVPELAGNPHIYLVGPLGVEPSTNGL